MKRYISREATKSGFVYRQSDRVIVDEHALSRIAALAIPPTWTGVKISPDNGAKLQAVGRDQSGKKQYIYHPKFVAKQEMEKFDRILEFARRLPGLRQQVERDLAHKEFDRRKVVACAIDLMDQTYFRIGNASYARNNQSYGLTTLRRKHVSIKGSRIVFDFKGKSGQYHHKEVSDQRIARILGRLEKMPGYEIFRYYDDEGRLQNLTSSDVNEYIKEHMGDEFSAKDFRTWGGTLMAATELIGCLRPRSKRETKRAITSCVKSVAKKLGNTPAVARRSYIDPRVFEAFSKKQSVVELEHVLQEMSRTEYTSDDERRIVDQLRKTKEVGDEAVPA